MIVHGARGLTRLVALVVLPALGLVAAAFLVAAAVGEDTSRSLAQSLGLTAAWQDVGTFLTTTAPRGDTVVLLSGAGAVALGLVLLVGALAPARERELPLDDDGAGALGIRPRALRGAVLDRVEGARIRGIADVKVRLKSRRRGRGGRLTIRARRTHGTDGGAVDAAYAEQTADLADAFALKVRIRSASSRRRAGRVQ